MIALSESLEPRLAFSVTMAVEGATLFIDGDGAAQDVRITDTKTPADDATHVLVDADGNGSFADPGDVDTALTGIQSFVVRLRGGDDKLSFNIDLYSGAQKSLTADLGNGNNQFGFGFGLSQSLSNSHVTVDVRSGSGNDFASIGLNDIRNGSTLAINLDLGAGDDTLRSDFFGDVASGSALSLAASLGAGRDTYSGQLDYESFDVMGAGSKASVDVNGDAGADNLSIWAGNPETGYTTQIQGLLTATLAGGAGNDTITVTLPPLLMQGGTIAIDEVGGAGRDQLGILLQAHANSTGGTFQVALQGGAGEDLLTANVTDNSGFVAIDLDADGV